MASHDIYQLSQHLWVHPVRCMDLLMSSLLVYSLTWSSSDRATYFLIQSSSRSLEMAFLKAGHDNKVWGKENIQFNQHPCLTRQCYHIFLSLTFVSHVHIEAFLVLEVSGPIQFHLSFSLIPGFSMFLYSSHLPALASTLCVLPFYVWVLLGCPCSSTEFSWPFCISFWSLGWTAFDLGKGHP